jgi:GT2 family glycosyltransferase
MHDPDVVDSAGDGYLRCGGAFKHAHGQPAALAAESREVFGVCGAACMIRRDVIDDLLAPDGSLFDEDFFIVYEDVDLSYRARLRGHRAVYVADAVVEHAGSGTIGRASAESVFLGQRNLEWTWIKNTPWPLLLRSGPSHVAYGLAAGARYAASGLFGAWLRGKIAAVGGLPHSLRKRREIQGRGLAPARDLWRVMEPGWIGIKRREKRFDLSRSRRSTESS